MGENNRVRRPRDAVVDLVATAGRAAVPGEGDRIESLIRTYFAHADPDDLAARDPADLFGLAADHLGMAAKWQPSTTTVRVVSPRVDVEGWDCRHSVVLTVTDDLPFLVDSVIMALTGLGVGIHLVVHPIVKDLRSSRGDFVGPDVEGDGTLASLIAIEIDRQTDPDRVAEIEAKVRSVLGDVRAAVADWPAMRQQMLDIADVLADETHPLSGDDVTEAQELLRWLADDHFIFLGYREYHLDAEALSVEPGSGMGILRGDPTTPVRPLQSLPPQARARAADPRLLNLTKTGARSTVHRASYLDYVGVKTFAEDGSVSGERRFVGLYTAEVYTQSVTRIPGVRRLVGQVIDKAGLPPGGHDAKRLLKVLEDYPRDELLQIDFDQLFDTAMAIAGLQERRRVRLFPRAELFGRFVTCMVYIPRDRYNTATRSAIQDLLTESYGGSTSDWSAQITDSVLTRLLIHLRVENGDPLEPDIEELEARIEDILRDWDDDLAAELIGEAGEDVGARLARRYGQAFPSGYRESFSPRAAVADIAELEQLVEDGQLRLNAYRTPGQPAEAFKLKLYRRGEPVALTWLMPTLTNLGVIVLDEQPHEIRRGDGCQLWIYDFSLQRPHAELPFAEAAALVEQTFAAVWNGERADDGFNRLVLAAGLGPREVSVLRLYARYLHQTGITYSHDYIEQTLHLHADVAACLVELFNARFDPAVTDHAAACEPIDAAFATMVEAISSLDQDRILRRFHALVHATLRTTYFQVDPDGDPLPYLAVKLDPRSVPDLPEPRPELEIFVYSPRFEGVHLRSGPVARGGLRWSDRNEDYRTEILGLVKAQMVKNAVIVPSGAKGGFVLKRPPTTDDREALQAEVVACYRLFISALLDLTDNLVDGVVVPPERTVRHDPDDPYLVVAADKGTATFSDVANELAIGRGFWLGDAFASGGSHGYDHKGMGITARGAWESVKRHFRELGHDVQTEPFTVVGVGDMSGDVFGNGMLLSDHIRLVAAFDHRHIFIDPDPDPATSAAERRRLFELPRSSWADYDTSLLSPGGGVHPRTAKAIALSPEARTALDLDADEVTPAELMSAVLRAPVDLLWNGGIGTYIKATTESHTDVGDKANDAIRVDASDVRARVIGEGGNLGVTQRARIEFARRDGRINTDAIDNAGGVDCSDHEVNIKIALDHVVGAGDMTEKQRNQLLADMTNDVAALVLGNNHRQTQALSEERVEAASMADVHARYLTTLASRGVLDRALEHLPDAEEMTDRMLAGEGLTSPEIAVVLAYTKNLLNDELLASTLPDDEIVEPLLMDYFPTVLQERFPEAIRSHRLRREIIANRIANLVVDRAGPTMAYRLSQETSASSAEISAAHLAAWEIFQLGELTDAVNLLGPSITASTALSIHLSARQLAERATRQLLRTRPFPFTAGAAIADLAAPVRDIVARLPQYLVGVDREAYEKRLGDFRAMGVPKGLAERLATMTPSLAAIDVVEVAHQQGVAPTIVAGVHFAIADELELNWLRDRVLRLPRDTQWSSLARLTLRGDLYTDHRTLTAQAVGRALDGEAAERVHSWRLRNADPVEHYLRTVNEIRSAGPPELTTLLVAAREVRNLISRTG